MAFSTAELPLPYAVSVSVSEDTLNVDLNDGWTISAPGGWYARLTQGALAQRRNCRLIGSEGIHWPDLDEDISIAALLAGRRSGESHASLQRRLASRSARP